MNRLSRVATTAVTSTALAVVGFGLSAGAATAQGGYTWCPGQPLPMHGLGWDMNVCHSVRHRPLRQGKRADVRRERERDGELPLDGFATAAAWARLRRLPPRPAHCPPWNVIIGPSECGGL